MIRANETKEASVSTVGVPDTFDTVTVTRKRGRPPIGDVAMTGAERIRRHREKKRLEVANAGTE